MEIIFDPNDINLINDDVGITIGTFDGLHLGHVKVINQLIEQCEKKKLKSVIYTFSNIPREVITSEEVKNIISLDEKIRLISKLNIDYLILLEFNKDDINIAGEKFICENILNKLKVYHITIGHDFKFGKGAKGDYKLLEKLSKKFNYSIEVVEPVIIDNMRISSTLIRELLSEGNILEANKFLGRSHYYRGIVQPGKKIGVKLGFPTANLTIDSSMHVLKLGVYVTRVITNNTKYCSITNIGFNPTFNQNTLNFETYIFEFNENLYGKEIKVEFIDRIRDEMKFDSKDELVKRIKMDIKEANKIINSLLK